MSKQTLLLVLTVAVVAAISVYAHLSLGLVCPLPWPDESHFVWPAISLADHGTFVAPELNPDRAIFWMPPGYMTVLGAVFKIFGPSLDTARWFSLVCVLISFVFLLLIFHRLKLSWLAHVIAGWFYLNANFIACGNVARMEALLLAVIMMAFYFLFTSRMWIGIALLAISPLIHPNGFYFTLVGIALAFMEYRANNERVRFTKTGLVALTICLLCWSLYAVQVFSNWTFVSSDLAVQFSRKGGRSVMTTLLDLNNLSLAITGGFSFLLGASKHRGRLCLLGLALAAWAAYVVGFEMWYRVFWALAALLVTVVFFESLIDFLKTRSHPVRAVTHYGTVWLAAVIIFGWQYYRMNIESPINYPYEMKFFEMSVPDGTEYIIESDKQNIRSIIAAESATKAITVQFYPRAEALLYLDMRSPNVQLSDPLFYVRKPDLCIFHESKYMPPRWTWFLGNDMKALGLAPKDRAKYFLFERDDHERWYGFKP